MHLKQLLALAALPAWLFAKPGAVVYTSAGDPMDLPTIPICSSVASYHEYAKESESKGCTEHSAGLKVVIDAIVPATRSFGAIAKVHANGGRLSGYTGVEDLLPPIPSGVAVTLAPSADELITITPRQDADVGVGLELAEHTSAVTVRFDPSNNAKRDLLVQVTNGKFAGRSGWLFSRQAFIGSSPINVLKL